MKTNSTFAVMLIALALPANPAHAGSEAPGSKHDLRQWKITLPIDGNNDGKVDEIDVAKIQRYSHPDYFYLDGEGRMVFVAPNKAMTTAGSSNTRSELRHMLRGDNTRIKTNDPANNFAVEARKDSEKFGAIGGKLEATLRVDHLPEAAANSEKPPAFAAVVGQIHALTYAEKTGGFGWGNEPIKIFYKKLPGHQYGSVFWTYERNLAKDDPKRTDIAHLVWGKLWTDLSDPGAAGIPLGEDFSYTINVHRNTMYLTFENGRLGTVRQKMSLINNADVSGPPLDPTDNRYGYGGDSLYFKAGVYNQCSTKDDEGFWYAGCAGTGHWPTDKAAGNYAQVSFSRLVVGPSTPE